MKARLYIILLIYILACAANAYGQGASEQGLHRVSWPGKDWALDVALPDFSILEEKLSEDGRSYLLSAYQLPDRRGATRFTQLKVRLELAQINGSVTDFRDFSIKQLKKSGRANGIKTFEHNQIPVIGFALESGTIAGYQGDFPGITSFPPTPGMRAFFARDDVWITFDLNALSMKKEGEQLFYSVLDSVKFTDTSNPSSSFDYYFKAKSLIHQKQHKQAIEYFNAALGLERKQRQLDAQHWRNLIGHLVDLYVATGDRGRAKEVLDYGVSNDPTFPLFYLALAHHYASQDDVDNAIASLEKAYTYRKNDRRASLQFIWSDPATDPAFLKFEKNEKFRKAVKAMR
jgi:tetratricopeptide (TPR) repeat protein